MNIVFLDSATLGDTDLTPIRQLGNLTCHQLTKQSEVVERLQDADVCIVNKIRMTGEIMRRLPNLKLICEAATGTDNIDLKTAKELGIVVKNVAGYSTASVVQTTFALYLGLAERVTDMNRHVRGQYASSGMFTYYGAPFRDLEGATWGIVGLGTIGKRVAEVATALGANVIYYSTSGKNTDNKYYECVSDLTTLLQRSDVVSIHCPLNERTKGLIGQSELAAMKRDAVIINVARGGIIDEAALVEALQNGTIAGAGLDVFSTEPLSADSPLLNNSLTQKQLLLTPHIAWTSVQARERLVKAIADNICLYKKK